MESGNEVAIDMLQIQIADNDNSYVSWKTKCGEHLNTATGYKSLKTLLKDFPLRMRIDFRHLFCFSFSFFARQPPYIRSNHNILHLFAVQENLFEGFTPDYLRLFVWESVFCARNVIVVIVKHLLWNNSCSQNVEYGNGRKSQKQWQ